MSRVPICQTATADGLCLGAVKFAAGELLYCAQHAPKRRCGGCGRTKPVTAFVGRRCRQCDEKIASPSDSRRCRACARCFDLPHRRDVPACSSCRRPHVPEEPASAARASTGVGQWIDNPKIAANL